MPMSLESAIRKKDYRMISAFIENRVDINTPCESGDLPLWVAVESMEMEIVEFLINAGADPERSIRGGPNTYDIITMRNEIRMGCPSDWALSYINKIKNYHKSKKSS